MIAMRLCDRLASCDPAHQRDGRIAQIIERQQDCRGEVAPAGKQHKHPAQQQSDRKAADVAQKQAGNRLVEGRKTRDGAAERGRNDNDWDRKGAHPPEQDEACCHGHDFGNRHPVDAVHEVHDIDQPDAADEHEGPVEPPWPRRHDSEFGWKGCNDRGDGSCLQDQAGPGFHRATIINRANQCESCSRQENDGKRRYVADFQDHRRYGTGNDRGDDDRDPAALRRRCRVRRARVGLGDCVTGQEWHEAEQERITQHRGCDKNQHVRSEGHAVTAISLTALECRRWCLLQQA